jgi:hypothetical protein
LLKGNWRPADPFWLKADTHLDAVGDPDERNPAVHSMFLAVEGHGPGNRARASPFAGNIQVQFFVPRHAANREVAIDRKCPGSGLFNLY